MKINIVIVGGAQKIKVTHSRALMRAHKYDIYAIFKNWNLLPEGDIDRPEVWDGDPTEEDTKYV